MATNRTISPSCFLKHVHTFHTQNISQFHYQKEAARISLPGPYSSSTPTSSFTEEETEAQSLGSRVRSPTERRTRTVSPAMKFIISDKVFSWQSTASILGCNIKTKKAHCPSTISHGTFPDPSHWVGVFLLLPPCCFNSHTHSPDLSHPVVNRSDTPTGHVGL